jgi:hypothetical protein
MDENIIKLKIPNNTKIRFIITKTRESGILIVNNNNLQLLSGRLYYLPITTTEKFDDYHAIQAIGSINEMIDIRNVENQLVTITPIVNGFVVKNNQVLGKLI